MNKKWTNEINKIIPQFLINEILYWLIPVPQWIKIRRGYKLIGMPQGMASMQSCLQGRWKNKLSSFKKSIWKNETETKVQWKKKSYITNYQRKSFATRKNNKPFLPYKSGKRSQLATDLGNLQSTLQPGLDITCPKKWQNQSHKRGYFHGVAATERDILKWCYSKQLMIPVNLLPEWAVLERNHLMIVGQLDICIQ